MPIVDHLIYVSTYMMYVLNADLYILIYFLIVHILILYRVVEALGAGPRPRRPQSQDPRQNRASRLQLET